MAKGILIAAMDFSACREDEFHDWYDLEHVPERLRIPGFLNAERWIDVNNPDRQHTVAGRAARSHRPAALLLSSEPDLITSPAFIVMKAAKSFTDKTTAPNEMWQTDFTYLKIIGWGWMYLSTILDDFSRYVIAWKLCTTMKAGDVTDTLELALSASGCDQAHAV